MSDIVVGRQGAYWGTQRVGGRRDPRRHRDRRAPPPAQAGHRAAAVQPARAAQRVEQEYARLFDDTGYGATIWSPLASGLLTGKYRDGIPDDSRARCPATAGWRQRLSDERALAKVERLRPIADELGCSMAQLALAWCTRNPNVSTVITGASRPSQVVENFAALDVIAPPRRRRHGPHRRRRQ